jgi:hypothetical protein
MADSSDSEFTLKRALDALHGRCDFKTVDLLKRNPELEVYEEIGCAHNTLPMLVDR